MTYILIIILIGGTHPAIATAEFDSQKACEKAAQDIYKDNRFLPAASVYCEPKS
jgi:hypothetical protein